MALLEKGGFLYNHSGDFPQVILIVPSHVPNNLPILLYKKTVALLMRLKGVLTVTNTMLREKRGHLYNAIQTVYE